MKIEYSYFGRPVIIKNRNVYELNGNWMGYLYEDMSTGLKHVLGPHNKGILTKNEQL